MRVVSRARLKCGLLSVSCTGEDTEIAVVGWIWLVRLEVRVYTGYAPQLRPMHKTMNFNSGVGVTSLDYRHE